MSGVRLYPRRKPARDTTGRRWRVDYDLAYDGGGGSWSGHYRTRLGARIAAFLNVHVLSWGGSAWLHDLAAPHPAAPTDGETP